jgi:hypothetical protein
MLNGFNMLDISCRRTDVVPDATMPSLQSILRDGYGLGISATQIHIAEYNSIMSVL